jgi:hypothetical protein
MQIIGDIDIFITCLMVIISLKINKKLVLKTAQQTFISSGIPPLSDPLIPSTEREKHKNLYFKNEHAKLSNRHHLRP